MGVPLGLAIPNIIYYIVMLIIILCMYICLIKLSIKMHSHSTCMYGKMLTDNEVYNKT